MNNKLRTFMIGRYGIDDLYKVLLVIYTILILINIFIRSKIIAVIEVLLIIIMIYRVLSKNIYQRRKENDMYLKIKNKILSTYNYNKRNIRIEILICIRNVLIVGRKLDYHLKKENILLNVLSVVINLK